MSERAALRARSGLIGAVGLLFGASALFSGFYSFSVWGALTVALLAVLVTLLATRPALPTRPALMALLGLLLLSLWSLASVTWAESADQALIEASRWLLYSATLAVLVLGLGDGRLTSWLLGTITVSVLAVGIAITVTMLAGDGASLFAGNRLIEPLGYVNGQAGYLLLGFWPLLALAERARGPLLGGVAFAGATLLAALVVLSQTRAVVPAFVASAALLMVLPGRRRRAWVLAAIAAFLAVAAQPLLAVYTSGQTGSASVADSVSRAGRWIAATACLGGVGWAAAVALAAHLSETRPRLWARLRAAVNVAGAVVAIAGAAAIGLAVGNPADELRGQAEAFVNLRGETGGSRFTQSSGVRYDYWRIALAQFAQHPLQGVGAGNYDRTYFLERRSPEDITQPHSLELQTLAELGLVGAAALALFLVGVFGGLWRMWGGASSASGDLVATIGAGGIFTSWLALTSVDWLHNLPGVTGMALCAAAVLVAPLRAGSGAPPAARLGRPAGAVAGVLVLVLGVATVGRLLVAERYRSAALDALATDPRRALAEADRALAVNRDSLPSHYARAAAYARMDRYGEARATLAEAARREPHDPVPWALLGDLAVRRGDLDQARRDYGRALRLNPRDGDLRRLARDPASAA